MESQKIKEICVDIAFNPTDRQIKHLDSILLNSQYHNVIPIFVGSNLVSSEKCIELSKKYKTKCYVGVHPCDASEFLKNENYQKNEKNENYQKLKNLIKENKKYVLAVGECGLDYDRFHYSSKNDQITVFEDILENFVDLNLPFFFHSRNCTDDFINLIKRQNSKYNSKKNNLEKGNNSEKNNLKKVNNFIKGIVHSFTETLEEAQKFINLGLFIGLNGKSLNIDKENDYKLLKNIDLSKILIETDAPYCKLKDNSINKIEDHVKFYNSTISNISKASLSENQTIKLTRKMKVSNEPAKVLEVLQVISKVRNIEISQLKKLLNDNFINLFGEGSFLQLKSFLN